MLDDVYEAIFIRRKNKWLRDYTWWEAFRWNMYARWEWRNSMAEQNVRYWHKLKLLDSPDILEEVARAIADAGDTPWDCGKLEGNAHKSHEIFKQAVREEAKAAIEAIKRKMGDV